MAPAVNFAICPGRFFLRKRKNTKIDPDRREGTGWGYGVRGKLMAADEWTGPNLSVFDDVGTLVIVPLTRIVLSPETRRF